MEKITNLEDDGSVTIEQISCAARGWSIEITPAGANKIVSFSSCLEPGTSVNVTFLPGSDPDDTLEVAKRLYREEMIPIPHIAARSIKDKEQLEVIISNLAREANVSEVLIIGGGVREPVGEFDSSVQILETGLLQKYGIQRVGVAGHQKVVQILPKKT